MSVASPDGSSVAVVVRRGNPDQNTNDAELLVYRTAELLHAPTPRVVAKFSSASKYQPIALVQWLEDNESIVFAGTQGTSVSQVYKVDLATGQLTQLSHEQTPLQWYGVTPSGHALVTASQPPILRPAERPECLQRGCLVTAETLYAAEYGVPETSALHAVYDLNAGKKRVLAPVETDDAALTECKDDLKGGPSPDGRFGLRICRLRPHQWPSWWADYTAYPDVSQMLRQGANGAFRQWILVDYEQGSSSKLTVAPYFYSHLKGAAPLWIDGGRRLLLAGAFEPLAGTTGEERRLRAARSAVLMFDPINLRSERIATLPTDAYQITSARWEERTQTITIDAIDASRTALPTLTYQRGRKNRWLEKRPEAQPRAMQQAVELVVEQGLNDPPVLVAVDAASGVRKRLLDPNPWLAERRLGRVEAIKWTSRDGRQWSGGLYYPPNYVVGARYPLVLQTHGFVPNKFSLSGIARNFSAQPLAAHGIVVLQVGENVRGATGPDEWPAGQAGYEAAIDHLDALGLIDRGAVGIQGWSRSGSHLGYTLTHSSYSFVAGALTDSADFGWWWYLTQGAQHVETDYGAAPFGAGLDVWRRMAPSFNLDRVRTPMLMWQASSVMGLWDWYVGLRRLGKPVEYWVLPDGTHDVFKVGERMLTNQLLVDWFRFWLKNETDPDPNKAEQYARWSKLRDQQNAAPEVTTVATPTSW